MKICEMCNVLESIAEQNKDFKNFPVNSDGGFTR